MSCSGTSDLPGVVDLLICIRMEAMIPAALHTAKAKGALNARDSLLFGAKDQHAKMQCVLTAAKWSWH